MTKQLCLGFRGSQVSPLMNVDLHLALKCRYLLLFCFVSVQCQNLTVPDSGFYFISTNGSTSIANFSCAEGYYLEGNNLLTCDSNGMWNYKEPSCSKYILTYWPIC